MATSFASPLYLLAFDHRASFERGLFGATAPVPAEVRQGIVKAKELIFAANQLAVKAGAPLEHAGILVDEEFGTEVARRAKQAGVPPAMPVERCGQDEFDFEYGEDFARHVETFDPTFVKVLVRHNPDGDPELNRRQAERLARLSGWLRANQLHAAGQSLWLDSINRRMLASGTLAHVTGLTSNPTILGHAMAASSDYDESLKRHLAAGIREPQELVYASPLEDLTDAANLFRPTWEATGGTDGYVSLEVPPGLAYDAPASIEMARRLHTEAARPNLLVKISAVEAEVIIGTVTILWRSTSNEALARSSSTPSVRSILPRLRCSKPHCAARSERPSTAVGQHRAGSSSTSPKPPSSTSEE
ncbi:MAG: 2-deoxy-5-keto-D-gluconate 6-phosphate aldolase domain-containing protein [Acidimicrobiales bacterium]